jgi:phosphoribosylglycinamide formyltransferase-1
MITAMKSLVLFASGSGSNVENIIDFYQNNKEVSIKLVLTNKRASKVIDRCNRLQISCLYFNKTAFNREETVLNIVKNIQPDLIVLAGFLWKIPENFIRSFPNKIVNIHPALLPKFGGKGMYGMHVHQAVYDQKETETGITIHYVNENYDEGATIFQAKTNITPEDTPTTIAEKIHQLEYQHFPRIIDQLLYE